MQLAVGRDAPRRDVGEAQRAGARPPDRRARVHDARQQVDVGIGGTARRPAAFDRRLVEVVARAHCDALVVEPRAAAALGGIQPVHARVVDGAAHGHAVLHVADRHAVARDAAGIVGRAVDGVDQPEAIAAGAAFLLADDGVRRIALRDLGANVALDLAVHRGDDVVPALERGGRRAEGLVRLQPRAARERAAELVAAGRHSCTSTTRRSRSEVRSATAMRVASVASRNVRLGARSSATHRVKYMASRRNASANRS